MSGQYDAKQIIETEENQDNTPLDIDYHTAIDGGGYVDGYIETIEETDSSAIDIDYHTAVENQVGHVGGYTESSEESNPIDFEESTHENSNITLMLLNMKRIQIQVVVRLLLSLT